MTAVVIRFSRKDRENHPHETDAGTETVELTPEILSSIINRTLDERDRLDREIHKKHHDWIETQMAMQKERHEAEQKESAMRMELLQEAKKSALKWVIGLILAAIAAKLGLSRMMGGAD